MSGQEVYRVCKDRTDTSGLDYYEIDTGFHGIDERTEVMRVVEADIRFAFENLGSETRYSDGSWHVLYTAVEPKTALCEVAFHSRKEWMRTVKKDKKPPNYKIASKLMYMLEIDTANQLVKPDMVELVHPTDYSFPQECARKAIKNKKTSIRAYSARNRGGFCMPVLSDTVIKKVSGKEAKFTLRWNIMEDEVLVDSKAEVIIWQK